MNAIYVYQAPEMTLLDNKSLKMDGVQVGAVEGWREGGREGGAGDGSGSHGFPDVEPRTQGSPIQPRTRTNTGTSLAPSSHPTPHTPHAAP